MIEWLVYLLTGAAAGFAIAFIYALFKVGPGKPEFPFGRALIICLLLTWSGPFAYVEVMTRLHTRQFDAIVKDYFDGDDCPLKGKIKYYKVLYTTGDAAQIYLVADEPQSWGGNDSPLVKLNLKRSSKGTGANGGWVVDSWKLLRSDRLQKDSVVWPPYQ